MPLVSKSESRMVESILSCSLTSQRSGAKRIVHVIWTAASMGYTVEKNNMWALSQPQHIVLLSRVLSLS